MIEVNGKSSFEELRHLLDGRDNSRALARDIENNPICAVSFEKAVPCLFVQWRGRAESSHIRYIHEYLLRLIEQHKVSKVLGDDTALAGIPAIDQKWIVNDWMPRAIAAGLKTAASRKPRAKVARASVESIISEVPDGLCIRSFETLSEAKNWLRSIHQAGIYRIEYRRFRRGRPINTFAMWCHEPSVGHFRELARVALRSFWRMDEGALEPLMSRQPLPELIVITNDRGQEVHRWSLEDEILQLHRVTQ